MNESRIENRLKCQVSKLGGKAFKFISPGMSGVPDRIVMLPGGRIYFVELKAPGEKPRKLQEFRKKQLEELGFKVLVIDSPQKVDKFIEEVKKNAKD